VFNALNKLTLCEEISNDFITLVKTYIAHNKTNQDQLKLVRSKKETKGVTEEEGLLFYKNRFWIPNDKDLLHQVVATEHHSQVAGHFGQDKYWNF